MPVLARPGGSISYQVTGSGLPPLLLTHGFGATGAMFSQNLAVASARNLVVTWDIRGHGSSESPSPVDPDSYSADAALGDMAALLADLGIDRAVVGGHSLGGYLSLDFALRHPNQVAGLVLIGTGPGFRNDAARDDWNRRAHKTAARLEERGLAALGNSSELHGQHGDVAGLARAARHTLTQRDSHVIDGLTSIQAPALVIVGADDNPFLAAADYMAAKLPHVRKVVIPAAGHAPNVDQAEQFNAELRAFLDEVAAAEEAA
jgi:pimeloyl-ACP methyl ester carboxylesterase